MNVNFTVSFKGVPDKLFPALQKMMHDDIGGYPGRLRMDSAAVLLQLEEKPAKKKVRANAKS